MRVAAVSLLVALAAVSARAEEKSIALPADNEYAKLAPGPHSELAQAQCQFCHSTDYIVMQPHGAAKQWEAVVTKMIKVFGAPTNEADAKAIVEYLSSAYGPNP
jgi:hypothetical protein